MMSYSAKVGLPYDPAKAKAELLSVGVNPSKPLSLELLFQNSEKSVTLAQYLQSEIKKNLGIEIVLQPFDNKTFRSQLDLKVFPLNLQGWSADYPDPDNYLSVYLGSGGNNRSGWKNDKFDEDVLAARGLQDRAARREDLPRHAEEADRERHAVMVPLYYEPNVALVRKRVRGLEINPLNYLLLRKVELVN